MRSPTPRPPLIAWLASTPLALGVPFAIWITYLLCKEKFGELLSGGYLAVAAIGTAIHLAAYFVSAAPIFLYRYRKPDSRVWKPRFGLVMGTLIGAAWALPTGPLMGSRNAFTPYLVCGIYGFISAIAALRQRPRLP